MDNEFENNENKIEIIETTTPIHVETPKTYTQPKAKTSKSYGKSALAGCLVFGMALGSAFTLTGMKDSIVKEVTQSVQNNLVIPVNNSNDSAINQVSSVIQDSSSNIVANVIPSVVSIGILGPYSENKLAGAGTGVVFDQDAEKTYIVTNNHVISGANGVKIWFDGVEDSVDAKLVGTEPSNDLAVISVLNKDLEALGITEVVTCTFGNSDQVRAGDSVIAIGNAMGEGISVTGGMISSTNKTIMESETVEFPVIQTDAPINPGNSGGALVNSKGEVIGINTAKMTQTFNNSVEGVGYAIPSNDVVKIIGTIRENAEKPYLGIRGFAIDEQTAKLFSLPKMGVFVKDVVLDGPAANAGMLPNDVITSFNGKTITDMETLQNLIRECEVGDNIPVIVYRDNKSITLDVTMQKHDDVSF